MKRTGGCETLRLAMALIVAMSLSISSVARAQEDVDLDKVMIRVMGDVEVPAGQREAAVLVIRGDVDVFGEAELVVVVEGTARLHGAQVGELVVVQGEALLDDSVRVSGNIHLVNAELVRADGAVVGGEVLYDSGTRLGRGLLVFGLLFALGSMLTVLFSGLVMAAVAPRGSRRAGDALTSHFGPTLLATLFVWVGLPILAVVAMATVVGMPVGLGIFLFILPSLGFLGYLIVGIRLGDYVIGVIRGSDEAWHPYLAAMVGLILLLFIGTVPILGSIVSPIAAMLGAGTLALLAWREVRRPRIEEPVAVA
ncbi:MAG: hypothetical protein SH809_13960 [Rhodothermales bacterium]|nr:hypothetical protein [Rhodothermales bacterium]